jgi:predicted nucleic acid-binding protein
MIVVDSSVWVDYFNDRPTAEADALDWLRRRKRLVIGDLIMAEVLQGIASANEFRRVEEMFATLEFSAMAGRAIAIAAAHNHRALRARGVTPRGTIDTIIATFCIAEGHDLLHCDRDFAPFERHLGLSVYRA